MPFFSYLFVVITAAHQHRPLMGVCSFAHVAVVFNIYPSLFIDWAIAASLPADTSLVVQLKIFEIIFC
jgi:hypothetical protein